MTSEGVVAALAVGRKGVKVVKVTKWLKVKEGSEEPVECSDSLKLHR